MQLSFVDGPKQIASLDSEADILSNIISMTSSNIGLHVDDDPTKFFDNKLTSITINGRCIVSVKNTEHLGTVRYKGKFPSKIGIFIGIELDEANGDNDGT